MFKLQFCYRPKYSSKYIVSIVVGEIESKRIGTQSKTGRRSEVMNVERFIRAEAVGLTTHSGMIIGGVYWEAQIHV